MTRSRTETVVRLIAGAVQARKNCEQSGNAEWLKKHTDLLRQIEKDVLPSGSGIDAGTTIDLDKSTGEQIVLNTSFHHMNDGGMYDGWTEHVVTVRPSFFGLDIAVSGRDRNDVKEHLRETFDHCLSHVCRQTFDPDAERTTFDLVAE